MGSYVTLLQNFLQERKYVCITVSQHQGKVELCWTKKMKEYSVVVLMKGGKTKEETFTVFE